MERGSMRSKLKLAYVVALHLAVTGLLMKPNAIGAIADRFSPKNGPNPYVVESMLAQTRMDASLPDGTAIFLGDSIVQGLATAAVVPHSVNWGINFQTARDLEGNIEKLGAVKRAGRVVLAIGINDLQRGMGDGLPEHLRNIVKHIPEATPLVWSSVMPYGRADRSAEQVAAVSAEIVRINAEIRKQCSERPNCRYLETSNFLADANGLIAADYLPDRVHLSPAGYAKWIRAMRELM